MGKLFTILFAVLLCNNALATPKAGSFHILEEQFSIPILERTRTIRIYLPPAYDDPARRFGVIYMHDAQNLFDEATSYAGEWRADESLNALARDEDLHLIVVGIDNGAEHRTTELSAWDHDRYGKAEGQHYTDFIVKVLKPYIDSHYRTKSDAPNTAIMGSSMGALSSHYAIHTYPQVFSKAGIFSPSYWYSDAIFDFTQQHGLSANHKLYFLVGQEEGYQMPETMQKMVEMIRSNEQHLAQLTSALIPGGKHNEAFWSENLPKAVRWLFATDGK